jgi:prevent-host-death family protein
MNKHLNVWSLQDAKARLSGLIKIAKREGTQIITVHGRREVMIVPITDEVENNAETGVGLIELLEKSPLRGSKNLNLSRKGQVSSNRKIDL